jgi:hypothetical protein
MPSLQLKTFDHDKVVSISGRTLSPAPVGADMNLEERRAVLKKWLVREAVEEGKSRGDIELLSDILTCETGVFGGSMTERQERALNLYMFGNEEGIHITVIKVRGGKRVL